jgi:hypothetical protein
LGFGFFTKYYLEDKVKRMCLMGRVAQLEVGKMCRENLKERVYLGYLSIDGKIMIKVDLK